MPEDPPIAHRVYFPDLPGLMPSETLVLDGPEAHHAARVKRARPGERIALFDGAGTMAHAEVLSVQSGKNASLEVRLIDSRRTQPIAPWLEVRCPPPKGDRLETMIDQLSQLGVARWSPLRTDRAERDSFRADKLRRIAIESAKQCARAHLIEIGDWCEYADSIELDNCLIADATGSPADPTPTDRVLVLGPEGGWSDRERALAAERSRDIVRFGPHVMRIETAAVAGAACLLADARGTSP